ncbi:hypothetical protein GH771_18220 [Enterobacter cancerogenus]|nr:hypothetical protein GH771_18220 [Enterobacter cancerogenus]
MVDGRRGRGRPRRNGGIYAGVRVYGTDERVGKALNLCGLVPSPRPSPTGRGRTPNYPLSQRGGKTPNYPLSQRGGKTPNYPLSQRGGKTPNYPLSQRGGKTPNYPLSQRGGKTPNYPLSQRGGKTPNYPLSLWERVRVRASIRTRII